MIYRETSSEKAFLDKMNKERTLNRKTVRSIIIEYNEFCRNELFAGRSVYLPFGTVALVENKYKSAAIMKSRGRGHRHKFRPRMKFNQAFCQEVDRREAEITEAKRKNNETTE